MREAVCELAFGHAADRLVAVPYYTVTYLLVAGAYLISVLVPSIYVSLAFVVSGRASCRWGSAPVHLCLGACAYTCCAWAASAARPALGTPKGRM